jgi:hypothetical protein
MDYMQVLSYLGGFIILIVVFYWAGYGFRDK